MLSKIFDHVTHLINDIKDTIDRRTIAYRRKAEDKQKKTELTVEMVKRALHHGIYASYVLMDTWFASPTMFMNMKETGIDAICILKKTTKYHYAYRGKRLDVKSLFDKSMMYEKKTKNSQGIISSIIVNINDDIRLKIVYVVNKNDSSQWIAIATTDISMSDEEIIRIYEMRWSIEIFFKAIKSTFNLEKEFMTQSFEILISHTTIVFTRYMYHGRYEKRTISKR